MPRTFLVSDVTGAEVDLGDDCTECGEALPKMLTQSFNRHRRTLYCPSCDAEYEVVER